MKDFLRQSTIFTDAELRREYQEQITAEIEKRKSYRRLKDPSYHERQRKILTDQIAALEERVARLDERHETADAVIEASKIREQELRHELGTVTQRKQLKRLLDLSLEAAALKAKLSQGDSDADSDES